MKYFLFLIAIIFFSSCEEVIEVELNEGDQRIVIEGNIEADQQKAVVEISKSGSFYETNDFEKIKGADVVVLSESGEEFQLTETSDGKYELDNFESEVGDIFTLKINNADENDYEAETNVPQVIEIGELTSEKNEGIGGIFYLVSCFFQDTKNEKNYYRIKYKKNDELNNDYFVFDDLTFDGEYAEIVLFINEAESGDVIDLELISFDEDSYEYFEQVGDVTNAGLNNSVPYNPQGNINNEALGYFGARGSSRDTTVLE